MILQVRRNLAPHLKAMMATWLMSLCDLYAPAASAAKQAFTAAFPPNKQADAISFCKDDVMAVRFSGFTCLFCFVKIFVCFLWDSTLYPWSSNAIWQNIDTLFDLIGARGAYVNLFSTNKVKSQEKDRQVGDINRK